VAASPAGEFAPSSPKPNPPRCPSAPSSTPWRRPTIAAFPRHPPRHARHVPIQAKLYDGGTVEFEDPYRFGPVITDFGLHLHTEGKPYEAYRMLGAHVAETDGDKDVRFTARQSRRVLTYFGFT
jgi:hypothetical protein